MALFLWGCHPRSYVLEPAITCLPQERPFASMPAAFPELSHEEVEAEWGKELKIGIAFARELDLYRAITAFKRALFLMPADCAGRHQQAEFYLVQAYYLGGKYAEALETFECSQLLTASSATFPAFRELMIILYDAYRKTNQEEKAQWVMAIIEKEDPGTAMDLRVYSAVDAGNLPAISTLAPYHPDGDELASFLTQYTACKKSVFTAQTLNAILPGAGYYYVGQKKTALTSLIINAAFIAASYHFFHHGNWGAGLITTSLECGWYFGGINGAGLAAKEYNTCLYQEYGKDLLCRKSLFPVLMLGVSF